MSADEPEILVVGAGFGGIGMAAELRRAGIDDFVILEQGDDAVPRAADKYDIARHIRFRSEVVALDFDDAEDRWSVRTAENALWRPRVVVLAPGTGYEPAFPAFPGRYSFRGTSFHAARWNDGIDCIGKRVAVVGSGALEFLPELAKQAARVAIFQPAAPKSLRHGLFERTPGVRRLSRWISGKYDPIARHDNAELVTDPIVRITESGIATADGREREFDAIVYGTVFGITDRFADRHLVGANGLTIQQAWRDGPEGFLGVAVHGFPNLFLIAGPNYGGGRSGLSVIEAQARYIRRCIERMRLTASTRMEVRAATQHEFNRRMRAKSADGFHNSGDRCQDEQGRGLTAWPGSTGSYLRTLRRFDPNHYELTVPVDREPAHEYAGPALLDAPGSVLPVEVALSGHPDPTDGLYHWYGRISATTGSDLPDPGRSEVFLTIPGGAATPARLQERDPWGNLRIVGVGVPPYPLEPAEIRSS
ncbi:MULTISPECIES: DUF4873 domain-containing protein [unclassified Nocardia]|uniref:DUF4873 domain-containing protein n=1 Tax=unclassified Nocardia TaxID=2637762 RepID=UPI001CE474D7|nr:MULTISPECIES: DUF4873 domain-containing protein [unclassified Nocardia]